MGMGYGGSYADVIKESTLAILIPNEWEHFTNLLDNFDVSFDSFAQYYDWEEDHADLTEEENEELRKSFDEVVKAFKAVTASGTEYDDGLKLCLYYHNSCDNGSRYDEVDGGHFHVEGLYVKSPAFMRLEDKAGINAISRSFYVWYG